MPTSPWMKEMGQFYILKDSFEGHTKVESGQLTEFTEISKGVVSLEKEEILETYDYVSS